MLITNGKFDQHKINEFDRDAGKDDMLTHCLQHWAGEQIVS